jgi:hypothetical protein
MQQHLKAVLSDILKQKWGLGFGGGEKDAYTTDSAKKSRRIWGAEEAEGDGGHESSGWGGQEDCLSDKGGGVLSLDGVETTASLLTLVLTVTLLLLLVLLLPSAQPPPLLDWDISASEDSPPLACVGCEPVDEDTEGSGGLLVSGAIDAMRMRLFNLLGVRGMCERWRIKKEIVDVIFHLRASSSCAFSSRT